MNRSWLVVALLSVVWAAGCAKPAYVLEPDPTPYVRDDPTEYFLYLPAGYTAERAWPVFVGVHGFGGSGRSCLNLWQASADEEGYILVCPSLADESGGWYVSYGEKVLMMVLQRVRKECHTQKRVFLAGFSAGAEFVQAFVFDQPGLVAGVSVLSSGNYYAPRKQARGIPFLVVIGDEDDPAGLKGARQFSELLQAQGFRVDLHILPGVTHRVSAEAQRLTLDFYREVMAER
ncbi:MAG: hypothetical protein AB1894_19795 [Chloroflexota bacterium]